MKRGSASRSSWRFYTCLCLIAVALPESIATAAWGQESEAQRCARLSFVPSTERAYNPDDYVVVLVESQFQPTSAGAVLQATTSVWAARPPFLPSDPLKFDLVADPRWHFPVVSQEAQTRRARAAAISRPGRQTQSLGGFPTQRFLRRRRAHAARHLLLELYALADRQRQRG